MKPAASISLDLDNLWSYLKTQGAPGWETFPSYLDLVVPRILDTLDRCGQRITFFIVGQDATMESNRAALKSIAAAGHEIANHSFMHEPWLHLYSREQLHQEIRDAENAIASVTGKTTRGFRGPGFSTSPLVRLRRPASGPDTTSTSSTARSRSMAASAPRSKRTVTRLGAGGFRGGSWVGHTAGS